MYLSLYIKTERDDWKILQGKSPKKKRWNGDFTTLRTRELLSLRVERTGYRKVELLVKYFQKKSVKSNRTNLGKTPSTRLVKSLSKKKRQTLFHFIILCLICLPVINLTDIFILRLSIRRCCRVRGLDDQCHWSGVQPGERSRWSGPSVCCSERCWPSFSGVKLTVEEIKNGVKVESRFVSIYLYGGLVSVPLGHRSVEWRSKEDGYGTVVPCRLRKEKIGEIPKRWGDGLKLRDGFVFTTTDWKNDIVWELFIGYKKE